MDSKKLVWIEAAVGSSVGGYLPVLWGGDLFSFSGIILSGLGAMVGIYIGFKLSR